MLDIEVSALKGINLDKLEEAIHLQSDLLDLKANPKRPARGVIIESKLEKAEVQSQQYLFKKELLK